jgi:hypothetical protein
MTQRITGERAQDSWREGSWFGVMLPSKHRGIEIDKD